MGVWLGHYGNCVKSCKIQKSGMWNRGFTVYLWNSISDVDNFHGTISMTISVANMTIRHHFTWPKMQEGRFIVSPSFRKYGLDLLHH